METLDTFIEDVNRIAYYGDIKLPNGQRNFLYTIEPTEENLSNILEDALYLIKKLSEDNDKITKQNEYLSSEVEEYSEQIENIYDSINNLK